MLLAPSVISTITLAFEGRSLSWARHIVSAVPIAVPSGSIPMSIRAEHPVQQVRVGSERRLQEGAAGEDHQSEQIALALAG